MQDSIVEAIKEQFQSERELTLAIQDLNHTTSQTLSGNRTTGPAPDAFDALGQTTEKIQGLLKEIARGREILLSRVNAQSEARIGSIGEFINTLPDDARLELSKLKKEIFEIALTAKAGLLGNQADVFYTLDFHQRYLLGLLETDGDLSHYTSDGRPTPNPQGKLVRKTC